jgi:hypothetical protein
MAYQELGALLPTESAFRGADPSAWATYLRNQGQTKAQYLAQMDQFRLQLDETVREFNETLGFKKSQWSDAFGLEKDRFGLEKDKFAYQKEQDAATMSYNKWLAKENLGLKTRELDLRETQINKMGGGRTQYIDPLAADYSRKYADAMLGRMDERGSASSPAVVSGRASGPVEPPWYVEQGAMSSGYVGSRPGGAIGDEGTFLEKWRGLRTDADGNPL